MGKHEDKAKGEAKETLGKVTGDKDLEREGKVDKATGKAKDAADKAAEKAKDVVGKDREKRGEG